MSFLISFAPPSNYPKVHPKSTYLAEYVLNPFYDFLVKYYPSTWTPNGVTLFGIIATLTSSLLMLTAMQQTTLFEPPYAGIIPSSLVLSNNNKSCNSSGPSSLHPSMLKPLLSSIFPSTNCMLLLCSLLNAIYCIADNTDGRLARRLKKASEVGEYLDHGLDCVTSLLSTCVVIAVFGISFSNLSVTVFIVALSTVMSHTLNYERKVFIWGNRFFSVDEAMVFFCVGYWIPMLFPQIGLAKVPPALLYTLFSKKWAEALLSLRYVEVALFMFWVSQIAVFLDIAIKNWKMLFRITTLALVFNAFLLLAVIPYHTEHILTKESIGYVWGPFSYVALWFITAACTSSIIVHTLIFSHCASLPHVSLKALGGLVFVWFLFFFYPIWGVTVSVVLHILQIILYIQCIKNATQKNLQKGRCLE